MQVAQGRAVGVISDRFWSLQLTGMAVVLGATVAGVAASRIGGRAGGWTAAEGTSGGLPGGCRGSIDVRAPRSRRLPLSARSSC